MVEKVLKLGGELSLRVMSIGLKLAPSGDCALEEKPEEGCMQLVEKPN